MRELMLALAPALLALWAYRAGLRDGMAAAGAEGPPPAGAVKKAAAGLRARARAAKADRAGLRRLGEIMANVDAYDGTGDNQREVT